MELCCPECGTRFRVNPSLLQPEGTRVRCSVCGHRWIAFPEDRREPEEEPATAEVETAPVAEEPAPVAEEPEPPYRPSSSLPGRKSGRAVRSSSLLLKMLVVLLVLGLALELGYAFRSQWLAWPWARSAVAGGLELLGWDVELPVALRHYRVEAVHARPLTLTSGRHVTLVQGRLVNDAPFAQRPPHLELSGGGNGNRVRFRRIRRPGERMDLTPPVDARTLAERWRQARAAFPERLRAGQGVPFAVVLDDVPAGIKRFQVKMRH
jgi:predicted Zn finger-like uncharacterized protein